ncbi:MAG: DUF2130 domain-containing protein [Chthoniobacteraceae bacterium]|jgi:hypothetical protein
MDANLNITCPKCGAEIPLTEAVSHRLREQLESDFEKKMQETQAAFAAREQKIENDRRALEEKSANLDKNIANQVETQRKELLVQARQEAEGALGAKMKQLEEHLESKGAALKKAQEAELNLLKQKREFEEAKAQMDLEMARKLDEERKQIAETARQQAVEAGRLKLAERDEKIRGLHDKIAELQQRAEQGSTQTQGEALEITLEGDLRAAFVYDEITEVKKGQRGADVVQRVRTNAGVECGSILWETKRAKNWSSDWPEKLKEDQRQAAAALAVLVTTTLPEGLRGMGQHEGVWVCEPGLALPLAAALRGGLISVGVQKLQDTDRAGKMAQLYDHLCGIEFRQHVEAVVDCFKSLQEQLGDEQRAFAKQWKEREKQITKAIQHTAMMYGGIQGIAGREALPEIATLQLPQ